MLNPPPYFPPPIKTLNLLNANTVRPRGTRPRGTRPRGTRTSLVHDFKKGSKIFEISDFGTWTSRYTILKTAQNHIFHIWMVSFLHELMQYANSNHISNQNKLHICHIWMVFPFMNWCNMFIQIKYLIKLSLTERTFEMIFFLMNWGYMFIQLIFHLKLDITYFKEE